MKNLSKTFFGLVVMCVTTPAVALSAGNRCGNGRVRDCSCEWSATQLQAYTGGRICNATYSNLPCIISNSSSTYARICTPETGNICAICGCGGVYCKSEWSSYEPLSTDWCPEYVTTGSNGHTDVCSESVVSSTTIFRCKAGYYPKETDLSYGFFSVNVSGGYRNNCTQCPSYKNAAGTTLYGTSVTSSKYVSDCYIPANTSCKDESGTYSVPQCGATSGTGTVCL